MLTRRTTPFAALVIALALPLSLMVAAPAAAATVTVNTWAGLQAAMLVNGDIVVLTGPITNPVGENVAVESGESVTLDLNGFTLSITNPGFNKAAVHVPVGATLIINATGGGTITATGGGRGAGIGGGNLGDGGTVTVNGGIITATGGRYGAGIGGGFGGDAGIVTVNGGTITATGGEHGAGIGGGDLGGRGTVTVNGGTITATGGDRAAGIGGGWVLGDGGNLAIHGTPNVGNATTGGSGGGPAAGEGAGPITNPTMPPGVGYSAVTSLVGTEGFEGGKIVVVFNCLVTFDAAGGSSTDGQKVDEGGTAVEPADPTRTGYEFAGWQAGGDAYDFNTPVTDPVTLTATWTAVLALTGGDQGPFLPVALILLLLGGALLTVGRVRRA